MKNNLKLEAKNLKFLAVIAFAGIIMLLAAGCASLFGGGSVSLPRDMVGRWYSSAEAAAAGDESQLVYEVMANGTVIYHGRGEPATAQVTSFRRGEEVRSHTVNGNEHKQTFYFHFWNNRNADAGTQTPTLIVSDAPRNDPVFVNSRSY